MGAITEREAGQIEAANASGQDAGGVHPRAVAAGIELGRWAGAFEAAGYAPVAPGWPDDPETVEEARKDPQVLAGKGVGQVADHFAEVIGGSTASPRSSATPSAG